jgi:hypothetical protein
MKPIMRLAFVVDSVVIPAAAGPNHDVTVDGLPQASNGDAVRYEPYDSDRSPRVRLASARTGQEVSMDLARRFLAAVLIATLSFFAVACNGDGDGGDDVEAEEGEGEDD